MPTSPSRFVAWLASSCPLLTSKSAAAQTETALHKQPACPLASSLTSIDEHAASIWARTRHTNALRSALRKYYPTALEAFDDLADRDALAVLGRAPTPDDAAHLSLSKIRSALKRAGRQRNIDTRAQQIATALRTKQLTAPAPLTAAFASTTRAAVGIIIELNRHITELENELAAQF